MGEDIITSYLPILVQMMLVLRILKVGVPNLLTAVIQIPSNFLLIFDKLYIVFKPMIKV